MALGTVTPVVPTPDPTTPAPTVAVTGPAEVRPGLPAALAGFTIAQISDIHVGPTIKHGYVSRIVAAVNQLGADMVAVTGDLVEDKRFAPAALDFIRQIEHPGDKTDDHDLFGIHRAAVVGFFTLATFKLDHYVFPAAPALGA